MIHVLTISCTHDRGAELHAWLDRVDPRWRYWSDWDKTILDGEVNARVREVNDRWFQDRPSRTTPFHINVAVSEARIAMLAKLAWDVDVMDSPT